MSPGGGSRDNIAVSDSSGSGSDASSGQTTNGWVGRGGGESVGVPSNLSEVEEVNDVRVDGERSGLETDDEASVLKADDAASE